MEPFVALAEAGTPELLHIRHWTERYPELTAGFTTRNGGVSAAPFGSLNCGLHVADADDSVVVNRTRVADAIGMPLTGWIYGEQVHGSDVARVTTADAGRGTASRSDAIQARDAFITSETGLCLAAMFADCVPLYFYDPVHRAVGLAHAGWKGTVLQIAKQTVTAMGECFGSVPAQLVAAVGPSIGVCCYEVDDTVMDKVKALLPEIADAEAFDSGAETFYEPSPNGKWMLNLQQINRQIMIKAGILPSRIELTRLCTSCRVDKFYSHRKEQGSTGRMIAWIGLRK
ncbi:peptidoglycan editing factor PgeF [Paenibacillus sp. MBLB4367]|uniref:peptidoglycan editing factor PgeF n=1 Tax=Paenibacillus sp. MBLB4367 TaxID=3384767 RepID=UPI003907E887